MTLYQTPEASLTYHPATETLHLSYNATRLSVSFGQAYQRALEEMLQKNIGKLLLDLKRNAPPTDEEEHILAPLINDIPATFNRPIFIAAVLSEGQYQYQIGNYSAGTTLPPEHVEFNYFTSRREATAWLGDN
ncbi:hypothetical protein FY528_07055 [Hymenobacter lutimineralis]|uniref:STAS/SEC14 domain-containing protein n=1 Tax=Hymenobacter lutimineralis TaxID=2606448 RepID=A0A5D6V8A4_9BACT|nr:MULTISPECIES: hypothetical protein [Hymenobacter]QIX61545.1 hypothetical protein HER32_10305 [Hymenobacter sp. BT18]TYZ11445.1 hypothetical protein FY528_07055 [Hymenobacter lutimineralis]